MNARRLTAWLLPLLSLAACERPSVVWQEPAAVPSPVPGSYLTVDSTGHAKFVVDSVHGISTPASVGACLRSVRTVYGSAHFRSVWWSVRPDSSAVLYAAASADSGKTWGTAVAVDTSDVSSRGCNRPPPSATRVGDDVYVAYSMIAPEGTGVFFAHIMASMLHSPVAVIYGERLVSTAIAADSARVVVAYEQPNGKREQIEVALSSSQGHIFDVHVTATRVVDVAFAPSVALRGRGLAVSWTARPFDGVRLSQVVRVGRIE